MYTKAMIAHAIATATAIFRNEFDRICEGFIPSTAYVRNEDVGKVS
jgi:hypothetical protein